jgi:Ser/Thr protein kinase RdoA (MazF antagonist)
MAGMYQDDSLARLRDGVSGLLGHWQLSERTKLSLLCISENATYRADRSERDAPLVIRVHRPGYHTRAEIESELHWLNALRADDVVHTVCSTATRDGSLLSAFEQDGELRYVVAFEFMSGTEPHESGDLSARFRQLGEITARLHQHAKHWHRPTGFAEMDSRSTAPSPVRSMNEPSSNECAVTWRAVLSTRSA